MLLQAWLEAPQLYLKHLCTFLSRQHKQWCEESTMLPVNA